MQSLVTTQWLADRLAKEDLLILDATAHLPGANRDAAAEFSEAHIPGARFMALKSLTDSGSEVPSALPTKTQFEDHLSALGMTHGTRVVLYDNSDLRSSARAWFMFAHFGVPDVAILDGGLQKWRAEGRPTETGSADFPDHMSETRWMIPMTIGKPANALEVRSREDVLGNISSRTEQLVDARGAARFTGEEGDFRPGVANGHIPGSRNLPFGKVLNTDGTFKNAGEIRAAFDQAGINLDSPVITTCGSGITASVLLFVMHLIGKGGALYDGSWSEWGCDPDLPVETGPAR